MCSWDAIESILRGPIFPPLLRFLGPFFVSYSSDSAGRSLCAVTLLCNFLMEKGTEGDSRILSLVGENVSVASLVGSLNLFWRKVVFTSVTSFHSGDLH